MWTGANICALKSSICCIKNFWSEEASAEEMLVAGAAAPKLRSGVVEVNENEDDIDPDKEEDCAIHPGDAVRHHRWGEGLCKT